MFLLGDKREGYWCSSCPSTKIPVSLPQFTIRETFLGLLQSFLCVLGGIHEDKNVQKVWITPIFAPHVPPWEGWFTLFHQYTLNLHQFTTMLAELFLLISWYALFLHVSVHVLPLQVKTCVSLVLGPVDYRPTSAFWWVQKNWESVIWLFCFWKVGSDTF